MDRQNTEDFEGSKTLLCDTMIVDTCRYTFVKAHRMYSTKSQPECHREPGAMMPCQRRFLGCNEHPALVGVSMVEEAGGIWDICTSCSVLP